jgi:hypothetical protein
MTAGVIRRLPARTGGVRTLLVVTIDTEEEGRWGGGYPREGNTCANIQWLRELDPLVAEFGVQLTYLVDYPVADNPEAMAILNERLARQGGEIGAHLHPWCTPPFAPEDQRTSYAGRLPVDLQRAKLAALTEALAEATGRRPTSYRAGRWGLCPSTLPVLHELGYLVDSSVTPLRWEQDRDGPSFMGAPVHPYLLGRQRVEAPGEGPLLEIPATLGMAGPLGRILAPAIRRLPPFPGLGRVLEGLGRVWLRPSELHESVLGRATAQWRAEEWPVLNVMFHSSELMPGASPYVRDRQDLTRFLRRLEAIFSAALSGSGSAPATLSQARDILMGIS